MSVIVDIDHETGDLTQYTSTVTTGGDLSVVAGAALAGTNYGLNVLIDDSNDDYGSKVITADTSGIVRFRYYLDPNSIAMADTNSFNNVLLYNDTPTTILGVTLSYFTASGYNLRCFALDDAATNKFLALTPISDATHIIEIKLTRATTNIASDGSIELWIDGISIGSRADIDNYDRFPNFYRLYIGEVSGRDAGTTGTIFIDEIVANNDGGLIGPVVLSTINLLTGKLDRRGKL